MQKVCNQWFMKCLFTKGTFQDPNFCDVKLGRLVHHQPRHTAIKWYSNDYYSHIYHYAYIQIHQQEVEIWLCWNLCEIISRMQRQWISKMISLHHKIQRSPDRQIMYVNETWLRIDRELRSVVEDITWLMCRRNISIKIESEIIDR